MAILGPDGNPVSTADLNQEIAAPTQLGPRSVYREGVATGLTPESLAALLQDAAWGYGRRYLTLAEEMEERYLHYASQLQTRRLAIEAIEPVVEMPEGTPTKIADAVHGLVADPAFREMIGSLTDAVAKGYSAVELIWDYVDGLLKPVKYIWRDPRFFLPDRQTLTELRLVVDYGFEGAPLPPAKFAVHMPRSKMGVPLRRGVARVAAFAFMIQGFSLKGLGLLLRGLRHAAAHRPVPGGRFAGGSPRAPARRARHRHGRGRDRPGRHGDGIREGRGAARRGRVRWPDRLRRPPGLQGRGRPDAHGR